MPTDLYCYACQSSTDAGEVQSPPTCPNCGSDFVELVPAQRDQPRVAEPLQLLPEGLDLGGAALFGSDGEAGGMNVLRQLLNTLAAQGAQVAVHGPNNAAGGCGELCRAFNVGDFNFGNMEDLMNQLMEQHQPQNQPTARDTRENLPRRKVPPNAEAKGDDMYAPGSTCKAGDSCTVCHTEFEAEAEVIQLPCEHCFHADCILPWLELHHTCPICRAELPSESAPQQPPEGPAGGQGGNGPQDRGGNPQLPHFQIGQALSNLAGLMLGQGGGFPPDGHPGLGRPGMWVPVDLFGGENRNGGVTRHVRISGPSVDLSTNSSQGDDDEEPVLTDHSGLHPAGIEGGSASEWETDDEAPDLQRAPFVSTLLAPHLYQSSEEYDDEGHVLSSGALETEASSPPEDVCEERTPSRTSRDIRNLPPISRQTSASDNETKAGAALTRPESSGVIRGVNARTSTEVADNGESSESGQHSLVRSVAAPVSWMLRGAWHIGSNLLNRFA